MIVMVVWFVLLFSLSEGAEHINMLRFIGMKDFIRI